MSAGLGRTFELLARTLNPAAADALLAALDVPDDRIRAFAAAALVQRRNTTDSLVLVRRWPQLGPEVRAAIEHHAAVFGPTLRNCLLHGDPALRANALEMLPWLEDYSQIPTLLNLLESADLEARQQATPALAGLVDRLYEHLRFGKESPQSGDGPKFLRDAPRIRHQVLEALEASVRRYEVHTCPRVLECLLTLGHPDDPQVKRLLREHGPVVQEEAENQLRTSTRPGILALIFETLTQNYPLQPAIEAFSERPDPEFLTYVLQHWPRRLTAHQQRNFREIHFLAWVHQRPLELAYIPPGLHRTLVAFLSATGVCHDDKLEVLEWIVRYGSPDGRQAATEILANVRDDRIQEVVVESLDSEAPDVQAWATSQLRPREIPGAIEKLLKRLDSPIDDVRQAARRELGDFNIHRVLEMFESLDAAQARAVGAVVKKIDPDTLGKLRTELVNPIHRRRARALRCAERVGWLADVIPEVVLRLDDEDAVVRRTAVELLAGFPRTAADVLPRMTRDSSPRVREAAEQVLDRLGVSVP